MSREMCSWCDKLKPARYVGRAAIPIPVCSIACAQQWNRWERNKSFSKQTRFPGIPMKKLRKLRLDQIDFRD